MNIASGLLFSKPQKPISVTEIEFLIFCKKKARTFARAF